MFVTPATRPLPRFPQPTLLSPLPLPPPLSPPSLPPPPAAPPHAPSRLPPNPHLALLRHTLPRTRDLHLLRWRSTPRPYRVGAPAARPRLQLLRAQPAWRGGVPRPTRSGILRYLQGGNVLSHTVPVACAACASPKCYVCSLLGKAATHAPHDHVASFVFSRVNMQPSSVNSTGELPSRNSTVSTSLNEPVEKVVNLEAYREWGYVCYGVDPAISVCITAHRTWVGSS